jgi:hypothetical protein
MGEGKMSKYEKQIAVFGYVCGFMSGAALIAIILRW